MNIKIVSYNSVMIYFEQLISEKVLDEIQTTYMKLKELDGIIDITPSYCSILVIYDIFRYDHKTIQKAITEQCSLWLASANKKSNKIITIPTDYKNNLDLQRVANYNNLTIEEIIMLHTQTVYRVYAIGFMVGFAYLAKVDHKIATPRLETPRAKIPKGSVAIADNQTAIYPQDSAGGWNIIGKTTFNDFNHFSIGDIVKFERIK